MPSLSRLLKTIKESMGFLTDVDLKWLAHHDRLRQVLVRCGNCRFLAAAQDAAHLIAIIERDAEVLKGKPDENKSDYVRDVSLPTTDPIWH